MRCAPGFVSGYWLEPIDGVGLSIVVFETKEHADKAVAYPLPSLHAAENRDPREHTAERLSVSQ
jgi:hypothetical protein